LIPTLMKRYTGRQTTESKRVVASSREKADVRHPSLHVVLIGNFVPEDQHSMLHFADRMASGLKSRGVSTIRLRPYPFFSQLATRGRPLWKWFAYLDKFVLFPLRLAIRRPEKKEIVHVCDQSNALYLSFLPRHHCLVTCHDLLAVRSALGEFSVHRTGWMGRILQRWVLSGLSRSKMLVCVSRATRLDVCRIIGSRPASEIVPIGIDETFFSYEPTELSVPATQGTKPRHPMANACAPVEELARSGRGQHFSLSHPFLLHVGGTQWYKNRQAVRKIFRAVRHRIRAEMRLLIVGQSDDEPPRVNEELLSNLSIKQMADCYRRAALLVFPSYAEGFGLPIIEAQASGCLVVATGRPPMNEIGGAGPIYVGDPEDIPGFADAILQMLALNPSEAQRRRRLGYENAQRFRTDAMISGYLQLYQELVRCK
jgi:glycosyltransferase involved in cell wall biosynthesis